MNTKEEIQGGSVAVPVDLLVGYPLEYNKEKIWVKKFYLREITGYEEEILLSRRLDAVEKVIQVISSCTEGILGVKPTGEEVKVDKSFSDFIVRGLTPIDKVYLFIKLRVISLGQTFEFDYNCENPSCGVKSRYSVNLDEIKYTLPSELKFEYEVKLPSGRVAVCRLPVGEASVNLMKLSTQDVNYASKIILLRLVSLDGKQPDLNAVRGLSMKDRNYLREKFNQYEGILDTTFLLKCPICGNEAEVAVDFAQPGFFFPKMTE